MVVVGVVVGLMGLVYYERWMSNGGPAPRRRSVPAPPPSPNCTAPRNTSGQRPPLALMIAVGIGLHNFSEGLAIGQSAASGEISLALLLIIGFGLHNATEGFGIVAPLPSGRSDPAGDSALLGLIGGGPTFVGPSSASPSSTTPCRSASSPWPRVDPLRGDATAAVADTLGRRELLCWALLLGLFLGFATDFIIARPEPDRLNSRPLPESTGRPGRCWSFVKHFPLVMRGFMTLRPPDWIYPTYRRGKTRVADRATASRACTPESGGNRA